MDSKWQRFLEKNGRDIMEIIVSDRNTMRRTTGER